MGGFRHEEDIYLGRYVGSPQDESAGPRFLCDAPDLEPHVERPWFRAYAAERLDLPPAGGEGAGMPSGAVLVGHDLLALAYAAGMAPEQVTVLSPYFSGAGAPG